MLPGLLAAGAALGGGLINSAGALFGASQQRHWEQYMSNTAHQREVADLTAAGLNPILSATGGRGASTPQAEAVNPGEGIGTGLQQAARTLYQDAAAIQNQTQMTKASSAKTEAETRNVDADTILKLQGADRNDLVVRKLLADIANTEQTTRTSSANELATKAGIPLTEAQTSKAQEEAKVLRAIVPFITKGTDAIRQLTDALSTNGKMGDMAYNLVTAVQKVVDTKGLDMTLRDMNPWTWGRFIINLLQKHAPDVLRNTQNVMDPRNDPFPGLPPKGTK